MTPLEILTKRFNDHFFGPFLKVDQGINIKTNEAGGRPIREQEGKIVVIANVKEGYGHAAVLLPELGEEWELLANKMIRETVGKLRRDIKIAWTDPNGLDSDSLDSIDYTRSVFIFTDKLRVDRTTIIHGFKLRGYKLTLIDDDRWDREWTARHPDAFISHDFRNKDEIVRPLHQALEPWMLKIWYDEASLKLGDNLASAIDEGLTKARHGIIVITPEFLENQGWASAEMSAFLNRHASAKASRIILPVWHRVTAADVKRRSSLLANINAVNTFIGLDKVAESIARVIQEERIRPK